jgi:hypothetical protein
MLSISVEECRPLILIKELNPLAKTYFFPMKHSKEVVQRDLTNLPISWHATHSSILIYLIYVLILILKNSNPDWWYIIHIIIRCRCATTRANQTSRVFINSNFPISIVNNFPNNLLLTFLLFHIFRIPSGLDNLDCSRVHHPRGGREGGGWQANRTRQANWTRGGSFFFFFNEQCVLGFSADILNKISSL